MASVNELSETSGIAMNPQTLQINENKDTENAAIAPVPEYPSGIKLAGIVASLAASVFLCALDETIIATAIPRITDDFNSINDIGWYGSAYVFLTSIAIFEVGSLICATAPSSTAFIVGRACAGLGSAGINAGFIVILAASLPLERRPLFVSSYSGMYGIASVVAPLLGGFFTTKVTWRWCFYINLPIGGSAILVIALLFHPQIASRRSTTFREKMRLIDLEGTLFLVPGIICLLLLLQWGGSVHPWNSVTIILLIVASSVALFIFVVIQIWKQDNATIPPRVIRQRSVACSAIYVFAAGASLNVLQYYLPIWFQAIQGIAPFQSGIRILPTTMGTVLFAFMAGYGVAKTGYYTPFMIVGACLLLAGAALMTTWKVTSHAAEWVSYQIVFGAGAGLGIQQAHTAAQTVLPSSDVPTGAVIVIFAQIMGGTICLSIAQNLLTSELMEGIVHTIPELDPKAVLDLGTTGVRGLGDGEFLERILEVYNTALTRCFFCAVGVGCIATIVTAGMEWRSIKGNKT